MSEQDDGVLFCAKESCQRGFLSQEAYNLHMHQSHGAQIRCVHCQRMFDDKNQLDTHTAKVQLELFLLMMADRELF
jgi:uncharacterized C2H2 Zn-finger protein